MAGYLGYALQAGVQGFQSGFNMGQMKWQQNEKKKLEKKLEEMEQAASVFNNMVAQLGEDGTYSDDDIMKINTSYMALGYDTKEKVEGTYKAIQTIDKKTVEENYQWFDFVIEATQGMKSGDAQSIFDTVKPFVSGEKGLQMYEALESITKKKGEIAERPQEVSPYEFYGESPAGVQTGIAESVAGQTLGLEGVEFKEPTPTVKAPTAADRKIDWAIENYKAGKISFEQLSKFMGTDVGVDTKGLTAKQQEVELMKQYGATNEQIKNELLGISEPKPTEPKPETVTTLKNWEEMFDINAKEGPRTEEEYNRALELLKQSEDKYKPKYPTWKEALIAEVKGIGKELERTTDRTDRKILLDAYKRKLEEIKAKYPDVDLSQFPQPKELSGWDKFMEKVGF